MSKTVACAFCGDPLDPDSSTTYRKVTGWERPRAAGGTNALALREPTDAFACWLCIGKMKRGIAPGQGSLM